MSKISKFSNTEKLNQKSEMFVDRLNSEMHFQSELASDTMSFDWVNEIEFACPYIDNIVRNPKLALIKEEDIVKIEKARKITVASVKDLSRHTQFLEAVNEKTDEIRPSKILIVRNEETFNIYENRFIYTLIDNILRFIMKKEAILEEFAIKDNKVLEYAASTVAGGEKINIELKIGAKELPKGKDENEFEEELNAIKVKIKRIKDYITSWKRSEFIESLEKAHVPFVIPPIKKTNVILKNPNFQIASRLWTFLQMYDENGKSSSADGLDTTGNDILKGILDDSFLMSYYVLDSISSKKKEQKERLSNYAVVMIKQLIQRVVSLLLNSGVEISDEEILSMISNEIKNEESKMLVGSSDVKKKFRKAIDEYLEKTQDDL